MDSVGVCSILQPCMSVLLVRVLLFVILLSDMEMMSNFTLRKLRKSFSSLMWRGKDDIFRWITERLFSLILSLLMSFKFTNVTTMFWRIQSVRQALLLTGQEVVLEDLHGCHQMSNCDRVIVKFKDRKLKHNVQIKHKNLHKKSLELSRLKFSGKLFVSEAFKCRKLPNLGKIHSTWFYNNAVNIKLTENGRIHKIFHIIDIEKLLTFEFQRGS